MSTQSPIWDKFQDECVEKIFLKGGKIIDISGGLRISKKSNRYNEAQAKKYIPLIPVNAEFIVTDYTDTYGPDETQDIHNLTYGDNSIDGLFCLAVLEHIQYPTKAADEIVRVLKPGGQAFFYVPFLFRYHAAEGEYNDYFRYTRDSIQHLFKDCSKVEIVHVYGILETILKLTPLSTNRPLRWLARLLDERVKRLREASKNQTSGFNVYIQK